MNINEFERTKPTETLKAINDLCKFWENKRDYEDVYFGTVQVNYREVLEKIHLIKFLFKQGK